MKRYLHCMWAFCKGILYGLSIFGLLEVVRFIRINWGQVGAWEPETKLVIGAILVLSVIGALCIAGGALMSREPSMMHENEPQGDREWRSSKEK